MILSKKSSLFFIKIFNENTKTKLQIILSTQNKRHNKKYDVNLFKTNKIEKSPNIITPQLIAFYHSSFILYGHIKSYNICNAVPI